MVACVRKAPEPRLPASTREQKLEATIVRLGNEKDKLARDLAAMTRERDEAIRRADALQARIDGAVAVLQDRGIVGYARSLTGQSHG